ncbi:MAG: hypothetical protein A2076_17150 [Geobacteraceae bacterium GWC2_53_11]|nr:MAG: hypothetical protein A2076_17150 [Geobacteraceae bacterium GWC2_53_11]
MQFTLFVGKADTVIMRPLSMFRYKNIIPALLTLTVLALLGGCGGASTDGAGGGGFTFTGKINSAGTPVQGASVKLYQSSFAIYSTSINGNVYYGTRNLNGVESVTFGPVVQTVATNSQGVYSFTGLHSGKYIIQPVSGTSVCLWSLVPSRTDTGVLSITENGMVYVYNPDVTVNNLTQDGLIIYNAVVSVANSGNILNGLDFEAPSGGVDIHF